MNAQRNLFLVISEAFGKLGVWWEARQVRRRATATQPRRLTAWLPSPGNVIFTLAMIALLVAAQTAGALPLARSQTAPAAASTGTIAYQGRLADAAGVPLTGTYNMIFRLYDASTGGASLWTEQWTGSNGVRVSDGLFNVMLGSLTALPQAVIAGHDQLFLGITVGTDDEMAPRVQLGSVPFAVQALTVPDGSVTTAKIADGAVTSAKLAGGLTSGNLSLQQYTVQLGGWSTSSQTFVDISGSEIPLTVDRPSTLLVSFTGSLFTLMQVDSAAGALLTINIDGADRTDLVNQDLFAWSGACCAPNSAIVPAGFTVLVPVATGAHTVKLRVMASSYHPTYYSAGIGYNGRKSTFSVIVLGG